MVDKKWKLLKLHNWDYLTDVMEDRFLSIAMQAALEAGEIIAKYFGKKHKFKYKNEDKSDFATQADLESEQKIIEILIKNFPTHSILAEESGRDDKKSEYTWVIDPLDGTYSFSIGFPYFAVSIGLLKDNKPVLGALYHIKEDKLYTAQKGKGAFMNGQPIKVSSRNNLPQAAIVVDLGSKPRRLPKIEMYILPLIKELGHIYSIGSTALGMVLTACGVGDGTVAQAWVWDFVAAAIIVEEAGGKVTDFKGEEIDWSQDRLNVLASNDLIHDQIVEAIKK